MFVCSSCYGGGGYYDDDREEDLWVTVLSALGQKHRSTRLCLSQARISRQVVPMTALAERPTSLDEPGWSEHRVFFLLQS